MSIRVYNENLKSEIKEDLRCLSQDDKWEGVIENDKN